MKNLKLIKKDLIIPATGKNYISKAKDVFTGWIDSDFKNWGLDIPSEPKPETKVAVLELTQNTTFKQMFSDFRNLDDACLTQERIITFCQNHREHLSQDGDSTFFLFKVDNEFFVARVDFNDDGQLLVCVVRFSPGRVWRAADRHRVVVPQLSLSPPDTPSLDQMIAEVKKAGYQVIKQM